MLAPSATRIGPKLEEPRLVEGADSDGRASGTQTCGVADVHCGKKDVEPPPTNECSVRFTCRGCNCF